MTKISLTRLHHLVSYDPISGVLTWVNPTCKRMARGDRAGTASDGRRNVSLDGKTYKEHQIIWFYMTGEWVPQIDHRDLDGENNRWTNLRPANQSQNQANRGLSKNNTSGFKGVSYHKGSGKFAANIRKDRKKIFLGFFDTAKEAAVAYSVAATELFGEFSRN